MNRLLRRLASRRDDAGASLMIALIIVTVVSVIIASVLAFADASLRSNAALRSQFYDVASADGAAQITINTLRQGSFAGTGQCFGSTDTLLLNNFYQPSAPSGEAADSAAVTCSTDPALTASSNVDINASNRPLNALLTTGSGGDNGVQVNVADGRTVLTHGSVFANSTIAVATGGLTASASVTARGACTGTVSGTPAPVCNIGGVTDTRGDDPAYPAPVASTTVQTVPSCITGGQLLNFTPGQYTNITDLNNLSRCPNSILAFGPGVYYFNFSDTIPWTITSDYIVGGTPTTPLVAGTPPTIPGSCQSPVPPSPPGAWTPPAANAGVTFVFGGGAHIVLRSTQAELCGNYSKTAPPIAVYGLTSAVGSVPAESGCTIALPYPTTGCAVITTQTQAISRFYVQGTAYLPKAALNLAANNPSGMLFNAGLIVRTLVLAPTAAADLSGPIIGVPDYVAGGHRVVVTLDVYLCPGQTSCTVATGTLSLRTKVGITDASGTPTPGARQITVYSWSSQR
jgi:hypothetical protein